MRTSLFFRIPSIVILFFIGIEAVSALGEGGRIDMAVSPIRDEFTVNTSTPTSRSVQYNNNSDVPYYVYMTVEDCQPTGDYGTPICKQASNSGVSPEFSSTWIQLSESQFTVPPHSSKVVTYSVNVPAGAAPGGHYGAIFFNNPDTHTGTGANSVGMIRRIGMLYMMNIPGNIIVDPSIGDILVDGPGGIGGQPITPIGEETSIFDSAPDFIKNLAKDWEPLWGEVSDQLNPFWSKPVLPDDPFSITIKIPVKNDGNIHIQPTGKIYLYDENGNQLTQIGKESIINENGVSLGEKITDYLPINDEQGNVLPNTERIFDVTWQGFAYQDIDLVSKRNVIKFETPSSHYSHLSDEKTQFLYPWERLSLIRAQKTFYAKIEFSYHDITTDTDVVKNLDIPIIVSYVYISKTINYGMLVLVLFIVFFAWLFIRRRDRRIEELEQETFELTDEISVLEAAKKSLKTAPKKTTKRTTTGTTKKAATSPTPKKPIPKKKPATPAKTPRTRKPRGTSSSEK